MNNNCNCNNKIKVFPPFLTCYGATGPTGPTGPSGGATGPTARCNKSSIYIFKW